MSYVKRSSGSNEQLIHIGKFHWTYQLVTFIYVILIITLPIAIYRYIIERTTEIAITELRLVYKTGLISIKAEEFPVSKIENVKVNQSILGRMLGYGTIQISGTGAGDLTLPSISKPVHFRKMISEVKTS